MPTTQEFLQLFAGLRTIPETNELYKSLFHQYVAEDPDSYMTEGMSEVCQSLMDAHRQAMEALTVGERQEKRRAEKETAESDTDDVRVRPHVIRNWARLQGIPVNVKGRVPAELEALYREAHP